MKNPRTSCGIRVVACVASLIVVSLLVFGWRTQQPAAARQEIAAHATAENHGPSATDAADKDAMQGERVSAKRDEHGEKVADPDTRTGAQAHSFPPIFTRISTLS